MHKHPHICYIKNKTLIPAICAHTVDSSSAKQTVCGCNGLLPGVKDFSCVNVQPSTAAKLCACSADNCHINQDQNEKETKHKTNA